MDERVDALFNEVDWDGLQWNGLECSNKVNLEVREVAP